MKKDGVYYCMHKRDVMCAHAKERLTAIMKRLWLKFHNFSPKKSLKHQILIHLKRLRLEQLPNGNTLLNDASLTRTNSRIVVINIKIPATRNASFSR